MSVVDVVLLANCGMSSWAVVLCMITAINRWTQIGPWDRPIYVTLLALLMVLAYASQQAYALNAPPTSRFFVFFVAIFLLDCALTARAVHDLWLRRRSTSEDAA